MMSNVYFYGSDQAMKDEEKSESISMRVDVELSREFDLLKEVIPFSKKASIMKECLRIGLVEFKKQRPDIMKLVDDYKKHHQEKKRAKAS